MYTVFSVRHMYTVFNVMLMASWALDQIGLALVHSTYNRVIFSSFYPGISIHVIQASMYI